MTFIFFTLWPSKFHVRVHRDLTLHFTREPNVEHCWSNWMSLMNYYHRSIIVTWQPSNVLTQLFHLLLGSGPEGVDDICFHTCGGFSPPSSSTFPPPTSNLSLDDQIPVLRPKSQPRGPNPCFEAQIPDLRPKSQPQVLNPSLKAQIPALRSKFQPWGPNPNFGPKLKALWP